MYIYIIIINNDIWVDPIIRYIKNQRGGLRYSIIAIFLLLM